MYYLPLPRFIKAGPIAQLVRAPDSPDSYRGRWIEKTRNKRIKGPIAQLVRAPDS